MIRNIVAVVVGLVVGMIVGVLSLAGGVMNAVQLSTPAWTWIEMPL